FSIFFHSFPIPIFFVFHILWLQLISLSSRLRKKISQLGSVSSFGGGYQLPQCRENGKSAFVTFKDAKALEIALLLSGATIVDQIVTISPAKDYTPNPSREPQEVRVVEYAVSVSPSNNSSSHFEEKASPPRKRVYVNRAQEVVTTMLAKGSAISQDAVNKAKAFDEKHRLTANASAKVISFDQRVKLSEKFTVGISAVNEKVKSVDQRLHVSDRTMAAIFAAERKINNTGSAVKSSRYVTAGTSWLNGAFGKVAKAGQVAGAKTREKFNTAVSNLAAKVLGCPSDTMHSIHWETKANTSSLHENRTKYLETKATKNMDGCSLMVTISFG
ncbi:unnamed protein product, partial [Linum tenue]